MTNILSAFRHQNETVSDTTHCPCCAENKVRTFHTVTNVPVNSVLNVSTRREALHFPCGDINLGVCTGCGFIFNTEFDPDLVSYCSDCEESQSFSPTFRAFSRSMAEKLVETYNLRYKTIIEIGCGKGEFLKMLCSLGQNTGIGFDPAYVPGRGDRLSDSRVSFITDYYSDQYSSYHGDMICCLMTLEHINDPHTLLETVRRSIGNRSDTIVFFQVPNMLRVLRECAFEDIYYEHCSYFTPGSLARLFRGCDFDILNLRTVYDDQYICIVAAPASGGSGPHHAVEESVPLTNNYVSTFETSYSASISYWNSYLTRLRKEGKRAVIWGGGSKAVSFLCTLLDSWYIYYVVDVNPHRQGTYIPGTGQWIIPPDELKTYRPDTVIIMNPVYRNEIRATLTTLGLDPEIHVLGEHTMI